MKKICKTKNKKKRWPYYGKCSCDCFFLLTNLIRYSCLETKSFILSVLHNKDYDNTLMQYTAIFHGCKNDNFQMKNCDIVLILAKNIDHGYMLDLPQ